MGISMKKENVAEDSRKRTEATTFELARSSRQDNVEDPCFCPMFLPHVPVGTKRIKLVRNIPATKTPDNQNDVYRHKTASRQSPPSAVDGGRS